MENINNCLICVLTCNHLNFTKLCIDYLLKNTHAKYPILVIDNGSTDGTVEYLKKLKETGTIDVVLNGENLGISRSLNLGIDRALELNMDFCFVSNDIVVGHNWIEELRKGVYSHEKIGGASPYIGPEATYDDFVNMDFRNKYRQSYWHRLKKDPDYTILKEIVDELHGGNFNEFTENWSETRSDTPPLYEWFSMVMYIKKSTIEKVGLFDEQFAPSHWEDLDYMVRMNNAELYRIGVTGSYCFHFSTITTRSEWNDGDTELRKQANNNEQKFNNKWRIFLPYNQRRFDVPDGDKYPPAEKGPKLDEFFPVSDSEHSRNHDKWYTWSQYNSLKGED